MRLQTYINEGERPEIKKFKKLWTKVESECAPILKVYRREGVKKFLYRGLSSEEPIVKRDVIKNRNPKDMDQYTQKFIDDKLSEKFGWRPRSEGLFATGRYDRATEYGTVYAIFPVGNFKFVWSYEIYDLYEQISSLDPERDLYKKRPALYTRVKVEANELILSYTDKNLIDAIKSGNEVTIKCDKYYGVLVDMDIIDEEDYDIQDIILNGL